LLFNFQFLNDKKKCVMPALLGHKGVKFPSLLSIISEQY